MRLDEDFYKGIYTFQSIGSVAICDVIKSNGDVLDACAAPGGKSVLLSERCIGVTSCEIHAHRLSLIQSYAKRMGATNVTPLLADSTFFNSDFQGKFDAVLCDVPCSGFGTLSDNPDIKLKNIEFGQLNDLQYAILQNCSKYVKRGGELVYSTCTLFKEENDYIVEKFLKNHKDFLFERIDSPLNYLRTDYGLQFLPQLSYGVGFFVCKLRKI